jgi:hypothetical protein
MRSQLGSMTGQTISCFEGQIHYISDASVFRIEHMTWEDSLGNLEEAA